MRFLGVAVILAIMLESSGVAPAGPASAWNVPDAFLDVPWGASIEDAKKILDERTLRSAEGRAVHCSWNACKVPGTVVGPELLHVWGL
jgi:hypothetical protein